MNINTQIHVEYLEEYVFKSIMLEPIVLNKDKREVEEELDRGKGTQ
jgi:hypothetical protein